MDLTRKFWGIRPSFYPILPPPNYEESERVIGSIETFGTRRFPSKLNFGANHGIIEYTVLYLKMQVCLMLSMNTEVLVMTKLPKLNL